MNYKYLLKEFIENKIDHYMSIVETLYHNPEIGNQEFKSMALLTDYLENAGFETTRAYVVPTGFIAKYDSQKPGPTIAFMCEYDALPEVGHGCGHNLIAGIGVAAGEALKSIIDQIGGKVYVIGTPAEENFGGKVSMAQAGVFEDVNVALMVHPGTKNGLGGRSNALYPLKFEFFGKNAHACRPAEGASALDAAVMTFVQINLLRQFVEPNTYIHGVISEGGKAANVIPAYASLDYYFRAPIFAYAKEIADKATAIAQGIAQANGTTLKTTVYECPYEDTVINYQLAHYLQEIYQDLGIEDIHAVDEIPTGSTDVGAVSYVCPTIQGYIKIAEGDVQGHSIEMAEATISQEGRSGLINAAAAIAILGAKLITEPESLDKVKKEHHTTIAKFNH